MPLNMLRHMHISMSWRVKYYENIEFGYHRHYEQIFIIDEIIMDRVVRRHEYYVWIGWHTVMRIFVDQVIHHNIILFINGSGCTLQRRLDLALSLQS